MTFFSDFVVLVACGLLTAIVGVWGGSGTLQTLYGTGGESQYNAQAIHYCWGVQKSMNYTIGDADNKQEYARTVYSLREGIECKDTTQRGIVE